MKQLKPTFLEVESPNLTIKRITWFEVGETCGVSLVLFHEL